MVNEPLIHYLWKTQKFQTPLSTTDGRSITVLKTGCANVHQGPDFIDGQILTDQGTWTGNIEIHVKSSDWYCHGHELDSGYDDVILHVVWEYDAPVFRADDSEIPCFEVRNFVSNIIISIG